jgi:hypothetical protein
LDDLGMQKEENGVFAKCRNEWAREPDVESLEGQTLTLINLGLCLSIGLLKHREAQPYQLRKQQRKNSKGTIGY